MKQINKLKIITLITLTTLSFSACGGGGSDASFESGANSIAITAICTTNAPTLADINGYNVLQSKDVISKEGDVTIVTYHDIEGNKKVCKLASSTGTAYIIR